MFNFITLYQRITFYVFHGMSECWSLSVWNSFTPSCSWVSGVCAGVIWLLPQGENFFYYFRWMFLILCTNLWWCSAGFRLGSFSFCIICFCLVIIQRHNLSYPFYADDTKLYLPVKDNSCSVSIFFFFWLSVWHNKLNAYDFFLQLNNDKTETIIFGPSVLTSEIVNPLGPLSSNVQVCVKYLAVTFGPTCALAWLALSWKAISFS